MIGRLNHVAIVVPDLAAAAALYRDALGARVSAPQRRDDEALRETARRVLRRILRERLGKRPLIEVQLVRLVPRQ